MSEQVSVDHCQKVAPAVMLDCVRQGVVLLSHMISEYRLGYCTVVYNCLYLALV